MPTEALQSTLTAGESQGCLGILKALNELPTSMTSASPSDLEFPSPHAISLSHDGRTDVIVLYLLR